MPIGKYEEFLPLDQPLAYPSLPYKGGGSMAGARKLFNAINDLYTAYSWVLSAIIWWMGASSAGVAINQLAAWAGASPLQALAYAIAAAFAITAFGILWRLYALNKPMAQLSALKTYSNDFGMPVGSINFTGIGSLIRVEVYCIDIKVIDAGNDRLVFNRNAPGKTFSLSRNESHHLEIVQLENLPLTPVIHILVPTKNRVSETLRGSKFGLSVVAYSGLVNERVDMECWIDKQTSELHWEEA